MGASVGVATGRGVAPSQTAAVAAASDTTDPSDWLDEINRYRVATGLSPVTEQPAWEPGIENHLNYVANTPATYITGQYASLHTENPESPYYTASGALEAASSNLVWGLGATPVQAIGFWWAAPFHAIGMLRPQLTQVAFAMSQSTGDAGLDVLQGLDGSISAPSTPVLFPGPGITTDLLAFGGESPDPTETCGWQGQSVGLPLIAMLPQAPSPQVTATITTPTGTEGTVAGNLCVVDQWTYMSSDAVYGPAGLAILEGAHAVVLIPRAPLTDGTYAVDIQQPGQADVSWSFSAYEPVPIDEAPPTIVGTASEGSWLTVFRGQWINGTTANVDYSEQWERCDATGANCQPIAGEANNSYLLTAADVGSTIRVQETATNMSGPGVAVMSAATTVVAATTSAPGSTSGSPPGTLVSVKSDLHIDFQRNALTVTSASPATIRVVVTDTHTGLVFARTGLPRGASWTVRFPPGSYRACATQTASGRYAGGRACARATWPTDSVRLLEGSPIFVSTPSFTFAIGCHVTPDCQLVATLRVEHDIASTTTLTVARDAIGRARFFIPQALFTQLRAAGPRGLPASVEVQARWIKPVTKQIELRF
jgi:hypothetical protein